MSVTKVGAGIGFMGMRWRRESFMNLGQNCFNFPRSVENKEDLAIGTPGLIPSSFNQITTQMDFLLLVRYLICFQMAINVIFHFMYRVVESILQSLCFLLNAVQWGKINSILNLAIFKRYYKNPFISWV